MIEFISQYHEYIVTIVSFFITAGLAGVTYLRNKDKKNFKIDLEDLWQQFGEVYATVDTIVEKFEREKSDTVKQVKDTENRIINEIDKVKTDVSIVKNKV